MWSIHKAALFPSVVRICGTPLNPPTVGHYAILEMMESPFLYSGKASIGDLCGTVALLKCDHVKAAWLVKNPARWGWRQWLVGRRMRRARLDLAEECQRLARWLGECVWFPERFKEPTDKPPFPSAVPHSVKLLWILTEHYTEREVMSMSIIKAHALSLARAEMNGNQYETEKEYRELGIPEEYAYHPEDFPEIKAAIDEQNRRATHAN
jgi:hypothetical protein